MISGLSSGTMELLRPYLSATESVAGGAVGAVGGGSGVAATGERRAQTGTDESASSSPEAAEAADAEKPVGAAASPKSGGRELSEEEMREIEELAKTDREVRQHEQAHLAAGGSLVTSGPSYEYESGPDGKRYAVAGEVGISLSEGRTPEETVQRARQIRAAALAPADPSTQDRRVAAQATQMEMQALQEMARERQTDVRGGEAAPETGGKTAAADRAEPEGVQAYRRMEGLAAAGATPGAGTTKAVSIFA